ncbi:MAG: InlB B-repeat-containing protein [Acholeplasmataceae bacterium]|nr:InlB B-repeat-containing protein [Acholeplasmataceae bacterium]
MKNIFKVIGVFVLLFTLSSCKPDVEVDEETVDVSFVLPEGMTDISSISVVQGEALTLPQIDGLDSYQWYEDSNFETIFDPSKQITKDITLYLFSDLFDTIEYRGANKFFYDNLYEIKNNIYDPNQTTHLIPELEGHTFVGWYHDKEFTQSIEDNPFVNTAESQNYKVYAKYEINTHTFTKIVDGEIIYQRDIEYGQPLDLYYTEKYYITFDGWYLDQEHVSAFDLFLMPDEDVTLYGETHINVTYRSYASYDLMFEMGQQQEFVEVTGIVTSTFQYYVYITDGQRAIKVVATEIYDIGTEIRVVGRLKKSITSMTIDQLLESEVIDTNVGNPLSLTTSTIADIISTDGVLNDYMGYQFTITGRLQFEDGERIGISDTSGNHVQLRSQYILIYQELFDLAGYIVTLDVIVDDYYQDYLVVNSKQTIEEIVIVETKDEQDSFDEDIVWLENYLSSFISYRGYSIPRFAINGSEIILKSWSHPQYISDRNYIISQPENGLIMTVTLQITKGDLTQEISHEVRYVVKVDIESLTNLETSEYVSTLGVVYTVVEDGAYIGDLFGDKLIYVDLSDLDIDLSVNDYIEIMGLWEDHILNAFEIELVTYFSTIPSDELIVPLDKTITQIINYDFGYGTIISTSAYIEYHEELGEVWLKHHEDDVAYLVVNASTNDELLMEYDGQYIELSIIIDIDNKVLFIGLLQDITITTAP